LLLCSRRAASRQNLALVDWQLLLLFIGLFVVHRAVEETGAVERAVGALAARGVPLTEALWLYVAAVPLSNLVSNVPAVMLLLPAAADPAASPLAGPALALSSTLAGNLLLVGSIANLIVVDLAARSGVRVGWGEHARVGGPIALLTLGLAAGWLLLLG
jgi:Na+/H+ antiporter NhaD/arsenite permease-like protein